MYDGEEHGNVLQLIYFMGQESVYGDDFKWDLNGTIPQKQFTTGTWHRIVNKVSMDTIASPGNGDKNGRVQTWLDGELALDVDTLRLRDYDTMKVDKFYLSTFHGGSSAEWAPTHDCFIRYDNFTVSTDSIAVTANAPDTSGTERIWMHRRDRDTRQGIPRWRKLDWQEKSELRSESGKIGYTIFDHFA